ncbi:hypothetical protein LXL04_028694 [Taraxacum kok-saghyz]
MQGQNRSRAAGKEKDVESFWTIIPLTAGYNRISSCKVINNSFRCGQDKTGAVLGMLGDCCRAMGDAISAASYFDESVTFLSKVETDDLEVTHTLSVSLNKIGDLKYYEGDLKSARDHYFRALDVRRNAINDSSKAPS